VVRIGTHAGRLTALTARPDRPRVGPKLFVGRRAAEIPALARSLFSVCGRSQAIAARAALEAIEGADAGASEIAARETAVTAETLQEHAWKIFVETPRLLGREPEIALLAEGRRLATAIIEPGAGAAAARESMLDWARRALFEPAAFLELATESQLRAWLGEARTPGAALCAGALALEPSLGATDVELLPPASGAWIAGKLAPEIDTRDDFDVQPSLEGRARETGAIARTATHPLVAAATRAWGRGVGARLVARLVETAQLVLELKELKGTGYEVTRPLDRFGAAATGGGEGVGWAETARGLVVHRVGLEGDRVARYRIVAPTEWNFHPEGAFARGARRLEGEARAIEAKVQRLVASLDPCVGVRYEACHA
jgi:coenzyme F420-reducing hydrogenase alpha subunit